MPYDVLEIQPHVTIFTSCYHPRTSHHHIVLITEVVSYLIYLPLLFPPQSVLNAAARATLLKTLSQILSLFLKTSQQLLISLRVLEMIYEAVHDPTSLLPLPLASSRSPSPSSPAFTGLLVLKVQSCPRAFARALSPR